MRSLYRSLDQSPRLKELLKWLSLWLAAKRGLPVMAAIGLTVISLIVNILWVVSGNALVGLCGFAFLHLAILMGLVGVLFADPLGRA
ncbi:MAG: hypothetical protein IT324_23535 [Anaerolineae bacterium]|nr:hypothetical protein [Anaerolineae bacterium]